MTDEHRKLWVEACQERERIRAALQSLIKIGPRPWMDGGVTWPEWDAAMAAAETAVNIHKRGEPGPRQLPADGFLGDEWDEEIPDDIHKRGET